MEWYRAIPVAPAGARALICGEPVVCSRRGDLISDVPPGQTLPSALKVHDTL